jgi:hypothetical protein
MTAITLDLEEEQFKKLEEIAKRNGLSTKRLCQLILQEFTGDGNVYWGRWEAGPGRRFIIDWPKFSSRVLKLKNEELE